jgi:hypothetical protein
MRRHDHAPLETLSFRRQFVLGPRFVDTFPSWQRIVVDTILHLTVHPDLDVCHIARHDKSITLLGYILDPANPTASNTDIVTGLVGTLHTCDDLFEHTARLGGRWVLVARDGVRTIVLGDAAGLRQVAYTTEAVPGPIWCASQPGLIAEVVDLTVDREALAFRRAAADQPGNSLMWFPGDATPYSDIRCLLPNHYLDLGARRSVRFWPRSNLPTIRLGTALRKSSELLNGLMESAKHRFRLMLPLTAGWDSRLMLAASRSMAHNIFCFTAIFPGATEHDRDVTTPARLLARLGLPHAVLDCRNGVDDEFAEIYRRNVIMGHKEYCAVAQALLDQTPSDGVCLKGDVAEVAKCYYRIESSSESEITAEELARVAELPTHPFVIAAFDGWLADARAHSYNVLLLDLFFWEQGAGRLQEMTQAECDIARESFSPLNCRSLLTTMLSVPERYRQRPTFDLLGMLIRRLWPDVLLEPINGRLETATEARIRRAFHGLKLSRLVPRPIKWTAKRLIRLIS